MPKKAAGKKKSGKKAAVQVTAEQLLEQAQIALQYDDCESALDALRRASKLEPNNLEVIEAYGSLLAEMGDEEQATTVLRHAVQLSPEAGHEKYMYLGQLLEADEALAMTRKGTELLQGELDQAVGCLGPSGQRPGGSGRDADMEAGQQEGSPSVAELQAQLCSALCSLAEMLMGQAHGPAEGPAGGEALQGVAPEVEALLARAHATCSCSPEPGQALASLRYEQGRPEDALQVLRESMKLWFKEKPDEDEEDEEDEDEEMGEGDRKEGPKDEAMEVFEDEDAIQPSYEFRFECAKLLLELDDSTDMAIQVLEDLVEEDDGNPHTWHLLGTAYYGGNMLEEAQEIYEKGMKLLKKLAVPEGDELYDDYEDLKGAIEQAGKAAADA